MESGSKLSSEQDKRSLKLGLWFVLIIALAVALWLQWPQLLDSYQVEEDFRKFHWMNRFYDQELLPEYMEFAVILVRLW